MNLKVVIILLLILGGGAVAGVGVYRYLNAPPPGLEANTRQVAAPVQNVRPERRPEIPLAATPAPTPAATQTPQPTPSATATPTPAPQAKAAVNTKTSRQAKPGKTAPNPSEENAVVPVPVARAALGLVGADPAAEEVWVTAINDPNLSSHTRSDLIEDLNEEGFPDPKNITMDDLPLITNRLAMIEQQAPYAMDDVNAAAFQEAYKDLVNMYNRLAGGR